MSAVDNVMPGRPTRPSAGTAPTRTDLRFAPATRLAGLLRSGALTSAALTAEHFDRIERLGATTRAYVTEMRATALEEAAQADRELAAGLDRGPLHGIPLAVKDMIDAEGVCTAAGTVVRAGHRAAADSTVIRRLRAAGAIILGKLATTEGASTHHHPSVPAPLNPWDAGRCAGFSSSGSGVAVATGLCVAALGTDTGGSIRIPAAYTGVTGLKPTWGRVSQHGVVPLVEFFDVVGPLARSAADAAAVLGAIAGADPGDPAAASAPVVNYSDVLDRGIGGRAVGLDMARVEAACDPSVVAGIRHVAAVLAERGARIRPITLPSLDIGGIMPLMLAGVAHAHRDFYPARAEDYGVLRRALDASAKIAPNAIVEAIGAVKVLKAQVRALFDDVDLLLVPALPSAAPPVGVLEDSLREPSRTVSPLGFLFPFNFTGSPGIAFPTGMDGGLPVSAQLVGRHFEEALLLQAVHAFQSATDWHLRHPPH